MAKTAAKRKTEATIAVPKPNHPAERETVIQYDNDSDEATVYTWDQKINSYMTKIGVQPVQIYTNSGKPVAWLYKVPKRWATVRRPRRVKKKQQLEVEV